jgi:hypothetical protein
LFSNSNVGLMSIALSRDKHTSERHDIHALLHRNYVTMDRKQYLTRAVILLSNAPWLLYKPRVATLKCLNFADRVYLYVSYGF